jgi:Ca2+-binding EF-hand superfamily protein
MDDYKPDEEIQDLLKEMQAVDDGSLEYTKLLNRLEDAYRWKRDMATFEKDYREKFEQLKAKFNSDDQQNAIDGNSLGQIEKNYERIKNDLKEGEILNERYKIVHVLKADGFSKVFKIEDQRDNDTQ